MALTFAARFCNSGVLDADEPVHRLIDANGFVRSIARRHLAIIKTSHQASLLDDSLYVTFYPNILNMRR